MLIRNKRVKSRDLVYSSLYPSSRQSVTSSQNEKHSYFPSVVSKSDSTVDFHVKREAEQSIHFDIPYPMAPVKY